MSEARPTIEKPSLGLAILPLALTIAMVAYQIFVVGDVSPHMQLACGAAATAVLGWYRGYRWKEMQDAMFDVIHVALPAIFILYTIGMIISTWIAAGTVPLLIYYGLQVLSPGYFLVAACIICAFVSVATGTSWGTVGTMGLALVGIGEGLGIPMAMSAGAVISGAYFGDKMSPLSDSTNFAPAVVGTDLFTHIRNMVPVTVPAMLIALGVYAWVGLDFAEGEIDQAAIGQTVSTIADTFVLNPLVLIPALVVMILALRKMPALPGLFAGVVAGAIAAAIFQGASLAEVWSVALYGYKADTGLETVDTLLSKGGVMSMNWTVTLILVALAFGGLLEGTRCLETILQAVLHFARTRAQMMLASLFSVLGLHVSTGDIFLSMALPGRMFAPAFRGKRIHTSVLSRTMEDAGTLMSPLIPWSGGGVFVASTLGVATLAYAPWAIACWVSILIDIVYAVTGAFVPEASDDDVEQWQERDELVLIDGTMVPASRLEPSALPAQ